MDSPSRRNLIKTVLTQIPRGAPFDVQTLYSLGVSSALASQYVKAGWLERLSRGTFMFTNDRLERDGCLRFLATRISGLHVGGTTALALRGVRHNISPRERIILWGADRAVLPEWFTKCFPSRYLAKSLFSPKMPGGFGLQPLPQSPDGPLVSVPERALLEMLEEVGVKQGIEEARNIMESVRSVRGEVLETLLNNCLRVKVVLLCVQWADELSLDWSSLARNAVRDRLGHSRWVSRLKDGSTLILNP